jgi:hypothetical protein
MSAVLWYAARLIEAVCSRMGEEAVNVESKDEAPISSQSLCP